MNNRFRKKRENDYIKERKGQGGLQLQKNSKIPRCQRKALKALLGQINTDVLQLAASKARENIPCRIAAFANHVDTTTRLDIVSSECGGQNCHLDIGFADGVTCIARIRLDDPLLPPPSIQAHISLCEIATLKFLLCTQVPSPRVYAYELGTPGNAVGTPYILMEKLAGRPLDWDLATKAQRAWVMEQLADI